MTDTAIAALDIDFLYWEDCPSHEQALKLLEEVVREEGVQASIRIHPVETEEEAEALQFPGSPTIRVAGKDIVAPPEDTILGLSCRAYYLPNGRMSPLPPRDRIVDAIRQAS